MHIKIIINGEPSKERDAIGNYERKGWGNVRKEIKG